MKGMIILLLVAFIAVYGMSSAQAVCLANHTEMTLFFILVDPTNTLPILKGKLKGDDKPECFPGGHQKYGGARDVYFFQKEAFHVVGTPSYVYKVNDTVAKHSTVVFSIQDGQNHLKDMSKLIVEVIDGDGKSVYKGKPYGPSPFYPKK